MTTSSQIKSKSKKIKSKQTKNKQKKNKQIKSKQIKSKQIKSKQSKSKQSKSKQSKSKQTLQKKKKGNTKIKGGANCNDSDKVSFNTFKFSDGGYSFENYFICYNLQENKLTLYRFIFSYKQIKSFDISECILVKTELPKPKTETKTKYEIKFRTKSQTNPNVKIIKTTDYEDYIKLYNIFTNSTSIV